MDVGIASKSKSTSLTTHINFHIINHTILVSVSVSAEYSLVPQRYHSEERAGGAGSAGPGVFRGGPIRPSLNTPLDSAFFLIRESS